MEKEEGIYTIEDVANALGVSKTTVSRAISGKGRISNATRERVRSFIEEHDYRPNVMAQGLAKSKTYNLGFLIPIDYSDTDLPFFKECMTGICEEAAKYNYDVVISVLDDNEKLSQVQRMIANHKVDGIIVSRSMSGSSLQDFLKSKKIPFVLIGPSNDPEVSWVDNPNREASKELTGIMLMKGIQKLALIGGDRRHLVTESRCNGFLDAYQEQGIEADRSLIFLDTDNYIKTAAAVEQALGAGVDGIICMDDFITSFVLGCLHDRGVQLPSDLKIASLYDGSILKYHIPPITSLQFDTRALGRNACLMLLKQLDETVEKMVLPLTYQVILRESTK